MPDWGYRQPLKLILESDLFIRNSEYFNMNRLAEIQELTYVSSILAGFHYSATGRKN
jgi:hypothetical protein